MMLPEYDGPHVRYDSLMSWLSVVPVVGFAWAAGAVGFLAIQWPEREVTEVPAEARGTVRLFLYSHLIYAATVAAVMYL